MISSLGCFLVLAVSEPGLSYADALSAASAHPEVVAVDARGAVRTIGDRGIGVLTQRTLLSLSPAYRLFSEQDRGFEGQIGLSHGWNLADLATERRRAATEERALIAAERHGILQEVELDIAGRWIGLRLAEAVVDLAVGRARAAERRRDDLLRAFGVVPGTRRERASLDLYTAEAARVALQAQGERFHAQLHLAEALGRSSNDQLRTRGSGPDDASLAGLETCRERAAVVVVAKARVRAAQAHRAEVDASGAPVLTTGVAVQRESPDGWIGWLNLGVTLPGADPQARSKAKARAAAAAARAAVEGATRTVDRQLAFIRHEIEHARETVELFEGRLIPASKTRLAVEREGFAAGEVTVWALRRTEREHFEAEQSFLRAQAELSMAYARGALFARRCGEESP